MTFRVPGQEGHCDKRRHRILIDRSLSDGDQRRVLLYEMCHIGTPGHGRRFRAKLTRLAQMGEAWAGVERRQYEEARRLELPLTAQIRRALDEIATEHPTLRWPTVRRILSTEMLAHGMNLSAVAPWAERVWRRLRADHVKRLLLRLNTDR